jgi:NAD(P)-dependent dehydrogenase (short-subunit alcohol dehydrogenase family)
MKTIMVTGATSGLGLEITRQLATDKDVLVIMAVRNLKKGQEIAQRLGKNVSAVHLDLSALGNVADFVKEWNTKLDGLVNNAGVQFYKPDRFTVDSFEETIAVNHLAAFMLTIGLEKYISGGRVLFIGSGTHNPKHPVARIFGLHGAQYTSIQDLASGKSSRQSSVQRNLDRYATSKFLVMVTAVELARRKKTYQVFALDPGLMVGTNLFRTPNAFTRFLWKGIMPVLSPLLPDTSNSKRSASTAVWILTEPNPPFPNGTIFSYDKKPSKRVWEEVNNSKIGAEVYEQSLKIIERFRK